MRVLLYLTVPAAFGLYDAAVTEVARQLQTAIRSLEPELAVEHVGSTAVPSCGGKGIVDLAVLYPEGNLSRAKAVLDGLGFQKQDGPEPFPEERPMRVGCVNHAGRPFQVHAHVIVSGSVEHAELVWFRDRLRLDAALRRRYEERKRAILAMGVQDPLEYCKAKGEFIADELQKRQPVAEIILTAGATRCSASPST